MEEEYDNYYELYETESKGKDILKKAVIVVLLILLVLCLPEHSHYEYQFIYEFDIVSNEEDNYSKTFAFGGKKGVGYGAAPRVYYEGKIDYKESDTNRISFDEVKCRFMGVVVYTYYRNVSVEYDREKMMKFSGEFPSGVKITMVSEKKDLTGKSTIMRCSDDTYLIY